MNQVDVESEIRGLGKTLNNYRPPANADIHPPLSKNDEIQLELPVQVSTRLHKSENIFAGITIDRFENPLVQPQELDHIVFQERTRGGLDTRAYEKSKTK